MAVPLLASSSYSLSFGTIPPEALARRAGELGHRAVALTDRNGVYGLPAFIEACQAEGIRPILGTEMLEGDCRAILLARDRSGLARICRLLTERAAGGLDLRRALREDREGLELITDDASLLASLGGREGVWALLSPCNRRLWRGLLASGARPAATGEARFLSAPDRELQRLLLAIGGNRGVAEVADDELSPPSALLSGPAEFRSLYAELPEALAANEEIAERAALSGIFGGWVFPRYGAAAPDEGAAALLRRQVYEGAARRYGRIGPEVEARLERELAVIDQKGFSDYFLVVRDIVRKASRSCGRGSAAASAVSYCLGITDVDPIAHDLYFDRFLNPGREDPPDIDVDFAWDERDALLAEVISEWGEAHAARVSNHVRFQPLSALREAARAYGMPEGEISAFERRMREGRADEGGEAERKGSPWAEISSLAARIVGFPRHLGVHSGGIVITPDDLASHVPLERTSSGIRVTAWDKDGVEAAGLVKIDLLGNRSLAVVRDALANLRECGRAVDEDSWRPLEDQTTIDLLARGDTMGVFYVESPAMRLLQRKTGRGDFAHLVIHSSMIRPAANKFISEYIDRLGEKPWKCLHPLLEGLFDETFGIMCYQEDVCKAAIALAGFSASEADGVRKCLSKKDAVVKLSAYRGKFLSGARDRGVDEATARAVWEQIESFSGYSFVKAHSASYAMLSFRSAWLRAHRPAEFMAAVISNRGGFYSTLAYASEARRMGLELLPPDVNLSALRCRGRGRTIRFGLGMVGSLSEALARRIVEERERGGLYRNPEDFARRAAPSRDDAEALVGSGALDSLGSGMGRAELLMRLLTLRAAAEAGEARGPELFSAECQAPGSPSPRRQKPDTERKRLEAQMRYLGTTLAVHPLALWPGARFRGRTLARDLPSLVGRRVRLLGWPITAKPILTAQEQPMEFVSFEDETALYEAVLFPDAFRRFRGFLYEERPLAVSGLVEEDRGAITLTVSEIERIG